MSECLLCPLLVGCHVAASWWQNMQGRRVCLRKVVFVWNVPFGVVFNRTAGISQAANWQLLSSLVNVVIICGDANSCPLGT